MNFLESEVKGEERVKLAQSTFKTNASNSHVPNYNGNIPRHMEKKQTSTAAVLTSNV